jgi:hypothetical protein
MPELLPRSIGAPPPLWPASLPNPQAPSMVISGPPRTEVSNVLKGPTRVRVAARVAPAEYSFSVYFTPQQMKDFELWYRDVVRNADGEFYARWIGGSRVVAFIAPYQYSALGIGYVMSGQLVRTRIDPSACDAFIAAIFGAIYIDDGKAADIYQADLAATDIYVDQFPLSLIVANEC